MKRIIVLLLCGISINIFAATYTPFSGPATMPTATMHSVNNTGYMTTGSAYSTTVHSVGSYSPSLHAPTGSGPRRSGFNDITTGGESTDYDPKIPTLPLGDALIPLMLMALAMVGVTYARRKKADS